MSPLLVIDESEAGKRLDKYLSDRFTDYSRTYFQMLIEKQLVLVNGERTKKRVILQEGDEVEIEFILTPALELEAENIPLDILYEDEFLLAINKPVGMVVHPGAGHFSHTFVNALLYHCQSLPRADTLRPGIVHRLDKETSGVLLAAKQELMHQKLVELFAKREMKKEYIAVCVGHPHNQVIEGAIGRHPTKRKEMTILQEGGKPAKTRLTVLCFDDKLSVVRLTPETGRTHQLRVHLKSIGAPILGDALYGSPAFNKQYNVTRQLLHAERLEFTHPMTGAIMKIVAPLPDDMKRFIS